MLKWIRQCADGIAPLKRYFGRNNFGSIVDPANPESRPTSLVLDLTDSKTIASFADISSKLRAENPVCPVKSGGFLLTDPADVKAAFSNKALSNQPSRFSALAPKNTEKYMAASVAANIPPFLDAPRHVAVRRYLNRAFFDCLKVFTPKIGAISQKHIERLDLDHEHLLIETVARAFVTDTIGQFVGISASPEEMKEFTGALFRIFAPAQNAEIFDTTNQNLTKARKHLIQALNDRRVDQAPCLLNTLDKIYSPIALKEEKDSVIADNALLVLADGVENVEVLIGLVMMRWFNMPNRPTNITPEFVYVTINLDTPGQTISRVAARDFHLNGKKITEGTPVFLSLASANACSSHTEDFSFGVGRHKCIGEKLAIAMISTFCDDLLAAGPKIDASNMEYAPMFGHKWPRGVKITLERNPAV